MAERSDEPGADGIAGLQQRLDELRRSVELLGTQGVWAPQGQPPQGQPAPAPLPYSPPPPIAPAVVVHPPQPPPVAAPSPSSAPEPAPAGTANRAPSAFSAPPATSGSANTVAHVDAGPFADLVELRHFEDDLVGLAAVEDVRVRRFGRGRAAIEVGMTGPYDLGLELPRLGLPMDLGYGPDGELVVEFAPPVADPADPPAAGTETAAAETGAAA